MWNARCDRNKCKLYNENQTDSNRLLRVHLHSRKWIHQSETAEKRVFPLSASVFWMHFREYIVCSVNPFIHIRLYLRVCVCVCVCLHTFCFVYDWKGGDLSSEAYSSQTTGIWREYCLRRMYMQNAAMQSMWNSQLAHVNFFPHMKDLHITNTQLRFAWF